MIPAREVIYAFRQYYDRYDGKRSPSMDVRAESFHIDQAIKKFIEATIKLTEIDSIHREDIRVLEVKEYAMSEIGSGDGFNIYDYPKDHFKTLRRQVSASSKGCGNKKFPTVLAQTDDINFMLSNIYWKPSFAWEQSFCDEGEKGLYVWHDDDFTISKLSIDYYRKHVTFDCPSLADGGKYLRGGNTSMVTTDTGIELPENTLDKIIQIATLLSQANQGDDREVANRIRTITALG